MRADGCFEGPQVKAASLLASHLPPFYCGGGRQGDDEGWSFPIGWDSKPGEGRSQARQTGPPSRPAGPRTSTHQPDTRHPSSQGPGGQSLGLGFPICAMEVAGLVWGWGGGLGKGLAHATVPQCVEWIKHRYQESCSSTLTHTCQCLTHQGSGFLL